MIKGKAIVLANGWLRNVHAKTTHGLLRGSKRFQILGVIDQVNAGSDAGVGLTGAPTGIPVFEDISAALSSLNDKPEYCIVGVATPGGVMPPELGKQVIEAMQKGMSIVCGLHFFLSDDPEYSRIARECGVSIIDVRKPRPSRELQFWTGEIFNVRTPRLAVLGIDCSVGKRTTTKLLVELCNEQGLKAEMIYTGQTGWMQGAKHGFIFDSTINDFISGEVERVIIECERESKPDLMIIEGQSSLRNPSGPCGSEFILSGDVRGVILQYTPGRKHYKGIKNEHGILPPVEDEIALLRHFGAETLAVTVNSENMTPAEIEAYAQKTEAQLGIPVVNPLGNGLHRLLPLIRSYISGKQGLNMRIIS